MDYADSKLLKEIDKKKEIVVGDPNFYLRRSHKISAALSASSKMYSWWIEHPQLRNQLLNIPSSQQRGKIISFMRQGVERLVNAWNYINTEDNIFTAQSIIKTASLVEPQNVGFRDCRVSLGFQNYTPPNPIRVSDRLNELFSEVGNQNLHPVEKAAIAHSGIAGIQPFNDGNKRTARLYQDKILCDAGLVPAIIYSGERTLYLDLLEDALVGRRDNNLKLQRPFFDFVGTRVNVALDKIIGDLKGKHN